MTRADASCALRVRSTLDAIVAATEQAEAWLAGQRVPPEASYLATLAIEELVLNCIKYGYGGDNAADHAVDVVLSVSGGALSIEVVDDGGAFNPLDAPVPDLSAPTVARPIGGLGIHLLRELADEMTYERRDGTNRVVLTRRIA